MHWLLVLLYHYSNEPDTYFLDALDIAAQQTAITFLFVAATNLEPKKCRKRSGPTSMKVIKEL
jgi:hypothetical protein